MSSEVLPRRPSAAAAAAIAEAAARGEGPSPSKASASVAPGADRFSLLLLEDGECYFSAHTASHWVEDQRRVLGSLKVCSRSLFFVPRDVQQPIMRIPFDATTAIEALEEASPHGEDQFEVAASLRVEMRAHNTDGPYVQRRGDFRARFSLQYASADDVLPLVEELCLLAHKGDSKEQRAEAAAQLQQIIQEHEEAEQFNTGWLEDDEEAVVAEAPASRVSPLAAQPGRVVLSQRRIYFQPFNLAAGAGGIAAYHLGRVVAVAPRVYQLEDLGLEVFFSSRHSLYLAFRRHEDRAAFQRLLMQQPALRLDSMRSREQWTRDWVNGRISNFDYLMHLNREAGRSFKDLSQYPVMPWVVADYTSASLDLSDPAIYRDLSKPIGALNPRRLVEFQQRFAELKAMAAATSAAAAGGKLPPGAPPPLDMPPFLYGCHYSSPGYVVFYLMRSDPQLMLRLQNGRFDAPDRLFWSIADTWKSVLTLPSDVKELVPEFYSNDPSFLLNKRGIDFGCRSGGQPVGDVQLPPWAADAQDFLCKLQEALESPHVSAHLHKWIDLVFGRKARGPRAEAANNVFHYLTYDDVAQRFLDQEGDPGMRDALRLQMMEFGRTPRQLFTRKHPKRRVLGRAASALACFACFAPPAPRPPRPTNTLTGKPLDGRAISPVSRAVFKLARAGTRDKRESLLRFLEQTAEAGEPAALEMRESRGAEVYQLVAALRDAREGRPTAVAPPEEALSNLVRAVAALAVCPQNRRYLLEAGCLDALADALAAPQPELATLAVQALAMLAREDSPRLQALDGGVLRSLLSMLRQPPSTDALLAALAAITSLAEAWPSHRTFFARHDLLALLQEQLSSSRAVPASAASAETPLPSPTVDGTRPGSSMGLLAPQPQLSPAVEPRVPRRRTTVTQRSTAAESGASLLRRQQLLALAVLLLDDGQKEALLQHSGALASLLADCGAPSIAVRSGAFECLASLTAHDAGRQAARELRLLPMLLEGAAAPLPQVQRPAAACIANLCADPAALLGELGSSPGLAPVVALALSSDAEVQRHAAAALWHLAVQPEARAAAVEAGALNALLSLAQLQRNVAARDLARQALLRCCDDEPTRQRVEGLAAAGGLDAGGLAAMLTPNSARSNASSLHRKARHRKMYSEVPSSISGAISRSSSFRSGGDASPSFSAGMATAVEGLLGSTPQSPLVVGSTGEEPGSNERQALVQHQQQQQQGPSPSAANGRQQPAPPSRLQLPNGSPLPLPLITPVATVATPTEDGSSAGTPPAKQQQQQQQQVHASAAADEAADASPRGGVATKVRSLERIISTRTASGARGAQH